jgi:4-hydroxy-3-methylbut-2-enyl diphosphate reductase
MTRVLVAEHRGFCAGVERAVETVIRALETYGAPVYVRKHIVHNDHVIADLEARGAVFVDSERDVPEGARLVLAAHGVEPGVHRAAKARGLTTIDATCPLVLKVHGEVRRFAEAGYRIVLVGHAGHDEVIGTRGQAPDAVFLVETVEDARTIDLSGEDPLAYVTQTTLSVDDTAQIITTLRARFPRIVGPRSEDICYATSNRQNAVKELVQQVDAVVVIGSRESSNSNRLVETARTAGVPAWLVEDASQLEAHHLERFDTVGVTAGASTPERLVEQVCDWFRTHGVREIGILEARTPETVVFRLPRELRPVQRSPRSDDVAAAVGST